MANALKRLRRSLAEEDGAAMTEYAIVLALIAIVAVSAIGGVGQKLKGTFGGINNGLSGLNVSHAH